MVTTLKNILGLGQGKLVGLDVGSSSVKMVQLEKDDLGYYATAAKKIDIDTQTDDEQHLRANTIAAIKKCFSSDRVLTRNAVCGLRGPEVMVRGFSFPQLPPEAIEQAVLLEAQQICPFDINSSVFDYQIIDSQDGVAPENSRTSTKGIFVVATNDTVNNRRQCVADALVKNVLMDIDGLALLNCLNVYEQCKPGHSITILDVGSSFTNVIILGSDGLPFIRDLPYAGNAIMNQIAHDNNISIQTVEKVLGGTDEPSELQLKINDSLKTACRKLISDITETLRYYTLQEATSPIDKIFLCGGFALVEGFAAMLDERLPEKVIVLNPFIKIRYKADDEGNKLLRDCGPAMAVAVGLAMRSL
jgi:type IV pilus assembly protein PilM